mmetsp:Transcript_14613/g.30604  ORF Transcript_14613/g.30604 Transcript_14613/m.30604 type:complete len:159 (+) Transcript_14613:63-539(+)
MSSCPQHAAMAENEHIMCRRRLELLFGPSSPLHEKETSSSHEPPHEKDTSSSHEPPPPFLFVHCPFVIVASKSCEQTKFPLAFPRGISKARFEGLDDFEEIMLRVSPDFYLAREQRRHAVKDVCEVYLLLRSGWTGSASGETALPTWMFDNVASFLYQ